MPVGSYCILSELSEQRRKSHGPLRICPLSSLVKNFFSEMINHYQRAAMKDPTPLSFLQMGNLFIHVFTSVSRQCHLPPPFVSSIYNSTPQRNLSLVSTVLSFTCVPLNSCV